MIIAGIIILVLILAFICISIYNSLIAKKNEIDNAFSAIDAMLKKRFDLLPNLVETVKQYMQYESDLLTRVVALRNRASSPNLSNDEKLKIDQEMSHELKGLIVNVENYPNLKADQSFANLQTTWTESEEQIAAARRIYNAAITDYNNAIMMFPGSIFAGMLNYTEKPVLSISETDRSNINAKDLFNR
ncbi:LemA family protein [Pedobacter sp. PACM 27299]|uniref:LemA family protein n=1 Tax=Pedobacter sp. PACM 27299 TaxID=1727164 RepID=UPI0007064D5F|nr:LemA family protein [Pedobacter sp. PACM 27299]ALL08533.1 LemA family protein [Pedobacter sp. PACM 27299]